MTQKKNPLHRAELDALLNHVPGGIAIFEFEDKIRLIFANNGLFELLGYSDVINPEVLNLDFISMIDPKDYDALVKLNEKALAKSEGYSYTLRVHKKNNEPLWIMIKANPNYRSDGKWHLFMVITDVTREQEAMNELQYRVSFDTLTGIYNKETFYDKTSELLKAHPETKYILLRWNVERFKVINDLFGKETGDRILVEMANYFKTKLHGFGTYGRLMADHFAICFPKEYFNKKQLFTEINRQFEKFDIRHRITTAVGIYEIEDITVPVDQMCDRANLALHTIKGNYMKHYAFYDEKLRNALIAEQEISDSADKALKHHEFEIYLQPIYSIAANAPISAEVLIRWNHPTLGLLSPGRFIPLFEKNGFIIHLDHYILKQSCIYLKNRQTLGLTPFPISVNLSRMSLYNPFLCEELLILTNKYNVDPSLFKIEITESAYNDNPIQLITTIQRLHENGFIVLMDDFGSGYSSLNALKDIPVDILKIDMKFLENFESSGKAGSIVTSIVRMSKWLGMAVIAEGVETKTQLDFLRSIGCDKIQGYYYAKPMPIEQFEEHLKNAQNHSFQVSDDTECIEDYEVVFNGNKTVVQLMNGFYGALGFYEYSMGNFEAIRVNEAYYSMFHITPAEFVCSSTNLTQKLFSEDVDVLQNACKNAIESKELTHAEIRLQPYENEKYQWLHCTIKSIGKNAAKAVLFLTFRDITKEKELADEEIRAKYELEKTAKRLNYILSSIPVGVVIFEMNELFSTQFVSDRTLEMFGFTKEEYAEIKNDMTKLYIASPNHDALADRLREMIDSNQNRTRIKLKQKDGKDIWLSINICTSINPNGMSLCYATLLDITLYINSENERLHQGEIFSMLLDVIGTFTMDLDVLNETLTYSYINAKGERESATVEHYHTHFKNDPLICQESKKELMIRLKEAEKKVVSSTFEYRFGLNPDCYEWYSIAYKSIADENGKICRIIGTSNNIQRQKDAESAYEQYIQNVSIINPDSVGSFHVNLTKNICDHPYSSYSEIFNLAQCGTADGLIQGAYEIRANSNDDKAIQMHISREYLMKEFEKGHTEISLDHRFWFSDNKAHWLSIYIVMMRNPYNQDIEAVITAINIDDKIESETLIQETIEHDYDYIARLDGKTDTFYTLSSSSSLIKPPSKRGTDFSIASNRFISDVVAPKDYDRVMKEKSYSSIYNHLDKNDFYYISYTGLQKDGTFAEKKIRFSYIDKKEKILLVTQQDVSDLLKEEQKKQKELSDALAEAQKATRAKSEFLSQVSHDFRTPLNGIIGMTHLALNQYNNPEKTKEYLSKINISGQFLCNLVSDVLDVANIERGDFCLKKEIYEYSEFYELIKAMILPMCEEKGIDFYFDHGSATFPLFVDKGRFNQLFYNLFTNAVHFTPKGGEIHYFVLSSLNKTDSLSCDIFIKDNGIGMSREFQEHMFEPFTRESTEITTEYVGSGLGLTICKSIVDAMGGSIRVDSTKGVGTTVMVHLDLELVNPDKIKNDLLSAEKVTELLKGKNILIVEDNDLNAYITQSLLETRGLKSDIAPNGQIAVDKFNNSPPGTYDAVLMDIRMPVMDGITATKTIRKLGRPDAKTIPIFALSANALSDDILESLNAGMQEHLSKPINPDQIFLSLINYLV